MVWSVDEVVACTYQEDYCHSQLQEKKPVSNKRSSARLQVKHESRRKEKNWVHGNDAVVIRITFARTYLNFSWQLLKLVWSLMLSLISLWRPTHSLSLLQIDRWRQPCIDARTWRSRKISRWQWDVKTCKNWTTSGCREEVTIRPWLSKDGTYGWYQTLEFQLNWGWLWLSGYRTPPILGLLLRGKRKKMEWRCSRRRRSHCGL